MSDRPRPTRPPDSSGGFPFLLGALVGGFLVLAIQTFWQRAENSDLEYFEDVRSFVRRSYVRDVTDDELLDMALDGMVSKLDPYSKYYDRAAATDLQRETQGRYTGIGVIFRQPITEGRVLFTLPGAPGHQAGLRVGDQMITIAGRPRGEFSEEELRQTLREPESGSVRIHVRGLDGSERQIEVRPDSVVDPTIRHVAMMDKDRGVGYISMLSFSHETPNEFDAAFAFLKQRGMQALILDLRDNHGGVLASAVRIAQRFVVDGTIVSTEGRGVPEVYYADPLQAHNAGFPVVVLVDRGSASASEVLAGALQDHRAGVVLGSPTFGKGMVQTVRHFPERETVAKVTSSYYFSPGRRNFERTATPGREFGIQPDLSIPVAGRERQRVHAFLEGYGPPPEAIPSLEEWESAEDVTLIARHPHDTQLATALELFQGRRPGPHTVTPRVAE